MAEGSPMLVVDHRSASGPQLSHVRGSLLVSSLQTLRELGMHERYLAKLPAALHQSVPFVLASSWVSMELAMAHYAACDAMELGESELAIIGQRVCNRIMGTFIGTLVRGARPSGSNVASIALPAYPRIYDRVMQGGHVRIHLTGPKDATIETRGIAMFRFRYFRIGHQNLVRGAGMMLAKAFYVRELEASDAGSTLALSWV